MSQIWNLETRLWWYDLENSQSTSAGSYGQEQSVPETHKHPLDPDFDYF